MKRQWKILVVDDEEVMRESLAAWLREDGYTVDTAASGAEAIRRVTADDYAICFVDLKMPPGIDGIETMIEIQKIRLDMPVVIITAYATVDTAITAMKEGAQEYIVKPCNPQEISLLVERIIRMKNLERENLLLRERLEKQYTFYDIISKNPKMAEIFELIRDVASLRSTVLIQGESGTGKEMIARAIHRSGDRVEQPFVAISCAALAESLLESELFGHERGAFTGAIERKKGKFELADGGTLFLDEIGDISPKLQADLLRVLQERSFFLVGGTEEVQVNVRVIAATHANLQEKVRAGEFREDLFYRLNVIDVRIPPLRERREDVPLLVRHFIERIALELGREITDISEGAIRLLIDYDWPGNVRELENALERAMVSCRERVLGAENFSFLVARAAEDERGWTPPGTQTLAELERKAIEATLRRTDGGVAEAARILGIDRSTLYDKIKKYGIKRG
ncbi:MAG: sigma-54-dependent Fis family transcriptional regulator [Candidatus Eisenbacteria sp.]|nr:sigma-54-dependent Fis family transcriptional regulator [Candidatus Eisenbacteria bacterium]